MRIRPVVDELSGDVIVHLQVPHVNGNGVGSGKATHVVLPSRNACQYLTQHETDCYAPRFPW